MYTDLFQIAHNRGIYQTIYLWAMLSPRLAVNKPPTNSGLEAVKQYDDQQQSLRKEDLVKKPDSSTIESK